MSLKIEQRLWGKQITEFSPRIFSTGVHLIPMKIFENDSAKIIWVADEFTDDIYLNGTIVSPLLLIELYD
ncbi:MAG: hypothetical protein LBG45_05615 [Dysgonamonadaceae bacterium]|jgi:hypothetical protein|nr:hypothetical protein [Dysgonamonadaceae bacterium]